MNQAEILYIIKFVESYHKDIEKRVSGFQKERRLKLDMEPELLNSVEDLHEALETSVFGERHEFDSDNETVEYWCCGYWRSIPDFTSHILAKHRKEVK